MVLLVDHDAEPAPATSTAAPARRRARRPGPQLAGSPGGARPGAGGRARSSRSSRSRACRASAGRGRGRVRPRPGSSSRSAPRCARVNGRARKIPRQPDAGREHQVARPARWRRASADARRQVSERRDRSSLQLRLQPVPQLGRELEVLRARPRRRSCSAAALEQDRQPRLARAAHRPDVARRPCAGWSRGSAAADRAAGPRTPRSTRRSQPAGLAESLKRAPQRGTADRSPTRVRRGRVDAVHMRGEQVRRAASGPRCADVSMPFSAAQRSHSLISRHLVVDDRGCTASPRPRARRIRRRAPSRRSGHHLVTARASSTPVVAGEHAVRQAGERALWVTTTSAVPCSRDTEARSCVQPLARWSGRGFPTARRRARSTGSVHQRPRHRDALLLAARQHRRDDACSRAAEPTRLEHARAPAARASASARAADQQRHHHVLQRGELGQQMMELEHEAELPVPELRQLVGRRGRRRRCPSSRIVAAVGRSSAPSRCSSVLFPEPEAPMMATNSPGRPRGRAGEHLESRSPSPPMKSLRQARRGRAVREAAARGYSWRIASTGPGAPRRDVGCIVATTAIARADQRRPAARPAPRCAPAAIDEVDASGSMRMSRRAVDQ